MNRPLLILALALFALPSFLRAQTPPDDPIKHEVANLTSEDFHTRQDAVKKLQTLLADQLQKRAAVQEVITSLQAELTAQLQSLAVVTDNEAQAHAAGLLEMERGLTAWTIDAMAEPESTRKPLLAWGLSQDIAPLLAKVYSPSNKTRVQALASLAKIDDPGADWTLSHLVNDKDPWIRAAAIAGLYDRKPTPAAVAALWYRAITGPAQNGTITNAGDTVTPPAPPEDISVDFPNRDPLTFTPDTDDDFSDCTLATDVLVHFNSPLVADRIKALVLQQQKTGAGLNDPNNSGWTFDVHSLVDAYKIKDAIEMLAIEANSNKFQMNTDEVNGQPIIWTDRTVAIGVILHIAGQDPADFGLHRVALNGDNPIWTAHSKNEEELVVQKFQHWWKDHYAQFGLKPSSPGVIPQPAEEEPPQNNLPKHRHLPLQPATAPVEKP